MLKRDARLYLEDIIESIDAIDNYLIDVNYDKFCKDRKTYAATIREFMIIGEAISKIINLLETSLPEYNWRIIKDFRNFIVHEYFGVNPKIVFDAAKLELTELKYMINKIKSEL